MDRDALRPRTRRKLNKSQIVDILERNVALYKDEDNFIPYLIELCVYLMEYEYDWSDSGNPPPKVGATESNETTQADSSNIKKMASRISFESLVTGRRLCPYCGTVVGDLALCPSCRNMTR